MCCFWCHNVYSVGLNISRKPARAKEISIRIAISIKKVAFLALGFCCQCQPVRIEFAKLLFAFRGVMLPSSAMSLLVRVKRVFRFLVLSCLYTSLVCGFCQALFSPRSRILWDTEKKIARLRGSIDASIDCDDLGALPSMIASVVKSTIVTPNSLKDILAILYNPEGMVAGSVLYVKNIRLASSIVKPTSLCLTLVIYLSLVRLDRAF